MTPSLFGKLAPTGTTCPPRLDLKRTVALSARLCPAYSGPELGGNYYGGRAPKCPILYDLCANVAPHNPGTRERDAYNYEKTISWMHLNAFAGLRDRNNFWVDFGGQYFLFYFTYSKIFIKTKVWSKLRISKYGNLTRDKFLTSSLK
jgi:hypothetical protein